MAKDLRKLLDYIVDTYVVRDELVNIELDASASDRGSAIELDKQRATQREGDRADELADAFAQGLIRARDGAVVLDDRNPDENLIADALIHFLVSHDIATSRTVKTDDQQYRYRISVNWKLLMEISEAAGVDLDDLMHRDS